ncbi:2'-5' RNA ligase family protein [Brevundimonas sp. PAMC22021]|uniref:2'-5' RNA ligase family protein n=1 Tax=Brevundimonas sp. PAMC22021 TaxID=2861285 RepID=UPI001C62CE10|nr:2'-5' RNA ligase family protein [Brevundimonas sp. PAMC22021]QYF87330.1 2'-5' RNA ligase family protein [Brevundimonas sp. PAMC22021]
MSQGAAPLILTLAFEPAAFEHFDALRRTHFPERLNHIPAHLTLFHHLPGERLDPVLGALKAEAGAQVRFSVGVTGLRKLGRGVAYSLHAPPLDALRGRLANRFAEHLTPQDRQGFRAHVTVQNKVDPKEAGALHDQLAARFVPWSFRAEGLLLWRYLGGPWERLAFLPFA